MGLCPRRPALGRSREPPGVAYVYEPDRKVRASRRASGRLRWMPPGRWLRRLQSAGRGQRGCAAGFLLGVHARRNFFDIQAANPAPIAVEALARIGGLYAIERDIRGLELRRGWPPAKSAPERILEAMKPWLEAKLAAVSGKSKPRRGDPLRAFPRWAGLTRFLDDGRVETDNNVVERAIRPITLARKNHLFAEVRTRADDIGPSTPR